MVSRSRIWRARFRRSFIRQTITRNLAARLAKAGFGVSRVR